MSREARPADGRAVEQQFVARDFDCPHPAAQGVPVGQHTAAL
jgi:hypothetical protein